MKNFIVTLLLIVTMATNTIQYSAPIKEFATLSLFAKSLSTQVQKINARLITENVDKKIRDFNKLFSPTYNFNTVLGGWVWSSATKEERDKALADVATLEIYAREIQELLKKLKPDFKIGDSVTQLLMGDAYSQYLNQYFTFRNIDKEKYDEADQALTQRYNAFESNLKYLPDLKKRITEYKPK